MQLEDSRRADPPSKEFYKFPARRSFERNPESGTDREAQSGKRHNSRRGTAVQQNCQLRMRFVVVLALTFPDDPHVLLATLETKEVAHYRRYKRNKV
jgi:hypothetical protein